MKQTEEETKLFKKFNDASALAGQWLRRQRHHSRSQGLDHAKPIGDDFENDPTFVDTLLDIGEETGLLAETKDIRDELSMITMVFKHQLSVLDDLSRALLEEVEGKHNQQRQAEIKKRFREQQKVIDVHLKDVERMDKQAEGIYTSVLISQLSPSLDAISNECHSSPISLTSSKNTRTPLRRALRVIRLPLLAARARPSWSLPLSLPFSSPCRSSPRFLRSRSEISRIPRMGCQAWA